MREKKAAAGLLSLLLCAAAVSPAMAADAPEKRNIPVMDQGVPVYVDETAIRRKVGRAASYVEVSYPSFEVFGEGHEALKEALEEYGAGLEEEARDFSGEQLRQLEVDVEEGFDMAGGYEESIESVVVRSDEQVVSILTTRTYYYRGAFHSFSGRECVNLDPETGEELGPEDVFADPEKLPEMLQEAFERQDPEPDLVFTGVDEAARDALEGGDLVFTVGAEGVSVIFNEYVIRGYAEGPTVVTLFYEEWPEAFCADIPFAGDYIAALAPYALHMFLEEGDAHTFRFLENDDSSLLYRLDGGDWETLEDVYYNEPERMVFLVREEGKHTLYLRAYYGADRDTPEESFRAWTMDGGSLEETDAKKEVVLRILGWTGESRDGAEKSAEQPKSLLYK